MTDERDKKQSLSQPLQPAPMPEYNFQQSDQGDRDLDSWTEKREDRPLDLSGVVFNFN